MIDEAANSGLHEGLSVPEVKAFYKRVHSSQKLQGNVHCTIQTDHPINPPPRPV
jgi:hypothetical protein